MTQSQVFRRRIIRGFAVVVLVAGATAAISFFALRSVIRSKDIVISDYARELVEARALEVASEQNVSSSRAYLLTKDPEFLDRAREARERFDVIRKSLVDTASGPEEARLLEQVQAAESAHQAAQKDAISVDRRGASPRTLAKMFEDEIRPRRDELVSAFSRLISLKEGMLNRAIEDSQSSAHSATMFVTLLGGTGAAVAAVLFFLSTRMLGRLERAEAQVRGLNEHLEQRVAERTMELSRAVKELENFSYTVAHDLRAPLRAMSGLSQLVVDEYAPRLDDTGRSYLERIHAAAGRMDELIQGLLDLARLSYGDVPLGTVSLSEILSDLLESKGPEIRARGARVVLDGPVPPVRGHAPLLKVVFDNVISNGLKFVKPGQCPSVTIHAASYSPWVRVSIRDNGIGIPPEHHDRIFGVFQRLHRAEEYSGVGIGLAVTRKALERMGGSVEVRSRPGAGSEFSLWLREPGE